MDKIKNNVDYHIVKDGIPEHRINWGKYDCTEHNWKDLTEIFLEKDFTDLLFMKLIGKNPSQKEKELFSKTLLMSSMGVGHNPPSVMIPKLISSTTKDKNFAIINGLIGGISSFGTDHLGAISEIMKTFEYLKQNVNTSNIENKIHEFVEEKLQNNERIIGFGHPVYKKDSRPEVLVNKVKDTYKENIYFDIYSNLTNELNLQKNINPNIDSSLALSYCSLGFEPEQGIYLSIISRSLSMVSHILEEFPKKPFAFLNKIMTKDSSWFS